MGAKRKRPAGRSALKPNKRTRAVCVADAAEDGVQIDHPVLKHYFDRITTLRQHLLADLQDRKRDAKVIDRISNEHDSPISRILDTVIVGYRSNTRKHDLRERRAQDVISFIQQLPSSTIGSNKDVDQRAQLEIVDFVIWLLFRRSPSPTKPQHLLAQGFNRLGARGDKGLDLSAVPGIPGIICRYSNPHVETVVSSAWSRLLALLGKGGDIVMVDLLVESCLFLPEGENAKSLKQFSGTPLSVLQPMLAQTASAQSKPGHQPVAGPCSKPSALPRLPSAIKFVRNRMFFAQPSLSAANKIKFGLHNIHVLNRYTDLQSKEQTVHILKHIFPRQFRLHNAFTSAVDPRESALPFKDYTLRESEIKRLLLTADGQIDPSKQARVPKRLSGDVLGLVLRLRKLHHRCAYKHMLSYYCSLSEEAISFLDTEEMPQAITDLATPASRVSAFCQAVIKRVIPNDFWGSEHNKRVVLKNIHTFLLARKFESFTLQAFLDGLKITSMAWLDLPDQEDGHHMSQSDFKKRKELLAELIYWLFDSFLIPLVRTNFHVTESNVHRNRLFYFRHDIWQKLCEPALESFKQDLFEELNSRTTKQRLAGRTFGWSTVRLLPKVNSFRPITNLRRRPYVWVNGKKTLGRSINSALNPAFRALNYEKSTHLDELGCSLFSVSDLFPKLKAFKEKLHCLGSLGTKLYFAKVDVQACFDTIPQQAVLRVVKELLQTDEYLVQNEARVKPPEAITLQKGEQSIKPVVKFGSNARPADFMFNGRKHTSDQAASGSNVLVAPLGQQSYRQHQVEEMITEHVEFNLIKIGRKFYRQKNGIPQGSILSSLLCNFFYGKLEKKELQFLQGHDGTLLLRLIDDFLLITTEKHHAERFLRLMHGGLPEYGVSVKPAKSLVNFDCDVDDIAIAKADSNAFPYCGLTIETASLDLSKNGQAKTGASISDSLTIEYSAVPGRTFRRKALNALKIQVHRMFFDTTNAVETVLANLYRLYHDAATRAENYIRAMPRGNAPSFETIRGTIEDLLQLGYTMTSTRRQDKHKTGYSCAIRKEQFFCIGAQAFIDVFRPRQTKHKQLLDWLGRTVIANEPRAGVARNAVLRVVPTLRTNYAHGPRVCGNTRSGA